MVSSRNDKQSSEQSERRWWKSGFGLGRSTWGWICYARAVEMATVHLANLDIPFSKKIVVQTPRNNQARSSSSSQGLWYLVVMCHIPLDSWKRYWITTAVCRRCCCYTVHYLLLRTFVLCELIIGRVWFDIVHQSQLFLLQILKHFIQILLSVKSFILCFAS